MPKSDRATAANTRRSRRARRPEPPRGCLAHAVAGVAPADAPWCRTSLQAQWDGQRRALRFGVHNIRDSVRWRCRCRLWLGLGGAAHLDHHRRGPNGDVADRACCPPLHRNTRSQRRAAGRPLLAGRMQWDWVLWECPRPSARAVVVICRPTTTDKRVGNRGHATGKIRDSQGQPPSPTSGRDSASRSAGSSRSGLSAQALSTGMHKSFIYGMGTLLPPGRMDRRTPPLYIDGCTGRAHLIVVYMLEAPKQVSLSLGAVSMFHFQTPGSKAVVGRMVAPRCYVAAVWNGHQKIRFLIRPFSTGQLDALTSCWDTFSLRSGAYK